MEENKNEILGVVVDSEEIPARHPSRDKILEFLRDKAVTEVLLEYSGSGDSGNIENPTFTVSGKCLSYEESETFGRQTLPLEVEKQTWDQEGKKWLTSKKVENVTIADAVTDMAYAMLFDRHAGWQDNDGSDGKFEIDVFNDKIKWVHNQNRVEQDTWEYHL